MKIFVVMAVMAAFCLCSRYSGNVLKESVVGQTVEKENLKREFCTVTEASDEFVLENTAGETYHLNLSWKADFQKGDKVLLIYWNREQTDDGTYQADVYAVYEDDATLQMPAG